MLDTGSPLLDAWLHFGVLAAVAVTASLLLHAIFFRGYARLGRRMPGLLVLDGHLLRQAVRPARLLLPVIALYAVRPWLPEEPDLVPIVAGPILYILLVVAIAWLLVAFVEALRRTYLSRLRVEQEDNLEARRLLTQLDLLRRFAVVAIVIVAAASILLHFETFRDIGAGLLASAGIAGIVLGFAAQRVLGNLLAGIQIALTQPIRIDDVVVVEGEWGRIQEISLTYVVVRVWDLRRLVLPISYFIEKPIQNWTRSSAQIIGTAFVYLDYCVPVAAVRAELERIVTSSAHWDGEVWRLHVTDLKERTVELRAMMSASNAGEAWELRCEVRERLLAWLGDHYPDALPRFRIATPPLSGDGDTGHGDGRTVPAAGAAPSEA